MSSRVFDRDANRDVIAEKTIAVIGYGNQGRAQALNLLDGGAKVVVGNIDDAYRHRATDDGIEIFEINDAVSIADIVMMLLPDEIQPRIFETLVRPNLRTGATLCFAHGYNIFFGLIPCPETIDVVLVAPKMIGDAVRRLFVLGDGFPTVLAVEQDATGIAWATTLALARAIGGTRRGAWISTFEEETVTDLFGEQVVGASTIGLFLVAFETLVEAGYNPAIAQLELYGSGELVEVQKAIHEFGLLGSLEHHSSTSRYGQLSRIKRMIPESLKPGLREVLDDIRSGRFAAEWGTVQDSGYAEVETLIDTYTEHPLLAAESLVRDIPHEGQ